MYLKDTITSMVSGSQGGAVAVFRVSGIEAFSIASKVLKTTKYGFDWQGRLPPRCLHRGILASFKEHKEIDDVLFACFLGPASYTGEDTVEIYSHAGPFIVAQTLLALTQAGARQAKPGEFTKRALLNGKMDVTKAEGVKALIEAQTAEQWHAAQNLYQGRLSQKIERLRSELISAMAWLEAMIDFPDEGDTSHVNLDDISQRVKLVSAGIKQLQSSYKNGQTLSQGLKICVLGAPNSGKSTLMNFLLEQDRAIVSTVRGTTRDYLEESCLINGKLVRVIDTAGIRDTDDEIEQQGISKSYQIAVQCDLVIVLLAIDASLEDVLTTSDLVLKLQRESRDFIVVQSKCDLKSSTNIELDSKWDSLNPLPSVDLSISCQTTFGLENLKALIVKRVEESLNVVGENGFVTTLRQSACLDQAWKYLENFNVLLQQKSGPELMAFELLEASRSLQEVVGQVSSEDILDKVFRDFCIGK